MNRIRQYEPRDLADLYEICVRTGASGGDATGQYGSDDLLGDIFAAPYATLEPELAFVVDTGDRVAGYLVATADTAAFVERYREEWLPRFDAKYPLVQPAVTADEEMIARGHNPDSMLAPGTELFPAHLHIDLLPELQGQGFGRALVRTLLAALRERDVPGVHLGVGIRNLGARAFYARLGFRPLPADPTNETLLGIRTDAEV
ncbi:GNAT family N-acetyltransferase [Lacisediminihabitans sp.]|uniref:GNAT family N-acetyltransferase n=1 Tax=Lacisediminihabitans sp. TaxID=2787631 RepID=UPI00374D86C4